MLHRGIIIMILPIKKTNKSTNNLQNQKNPISTYHSPEKPKGAIFDNMLQTEIQKLNNIENQERNK